MGGRTDLQINVFRVVGGAKGNLGCAANVACGWVGKWVGGLIEQ